MVRVRLAASALLLAAGAAPADAQGTPRALTLGSAAARSDMPLSLVTTVRELGSGAVMVADPIEKKVLLFPATLRGARTLGREGGGPGEYRQPDTVWPWPGDSTLVVDLGNARLSFVGPNGTWARSIPLASGGSDGPPTVIFPGGIDAAGRIYFEPPGGGNPTDSNRVMRFDPKTSASESIAKVKGPELDRQESGGPNNRSVRIQNIPLSSRDGWAVASDGSVALVRSREYRVDWVRNGKVSVGPSVSFKPVSIGTAEKKEWVAQQMLAGGISVQINDDNGRRSMQFGRARPDREPDITGYKWPASKPPFDAGNLRVDGRGRVWVRREVAAGQPRVHDVFGADGKHLAVVTFPAGRRLLGFGASALYAADVDEDGQYTLERYPLPL